MSTEKDPYTIAPLEQYTNVSDIYDDGYFNEHARIVADKGMRVGEAAEMYGNIATVEDYGYVTRGYVNRKKRNVRHGTRTLTATLALSPVISNLSLWEGPSAQGFSWVIDTLINCDIADLRASRYWTRSCQSWPFESSTWLHVHWSRGLYNDAMSR